MTEVGAKRQRSEEATRLTPSERTESLARRASGGTSLRPRSYLPSMFSVTPAAISQSRLVSVGSRLIRQILAVCDGAGRFCRGGKTSGSASAEPFGEDKERDAMHPDKRARRVSIVAGNQLESGCAVTTN